MKLRNEWFNRSIIAILLYFILLFSLSKCAPYRKPVYSSEPSIPLFPIPAPKPSAFYQLPTTRFDNLATLGDVDKLLSKAFNKCGYVQRSYFSVPKGFAVVTQLEKITSDGSPDINNRWVSGGSAIKGDFDLSIFIKRLFRAEIGYYRCIVFIVTPINYQINNDPPSESEAKGWLFNGALSLPESIKKIKLNDQYNYDALIYEFEKSQNADEATFINPSSKTGLVHLERAKLLEKIKL
jgi:hypothetical protein